MTNPFFERPILNSPYGYPTRHWQLDDDGQPTNQILETRRDSRYFTPVPKPRKRRRSKGQLQMGLAAAGDELDDEQEYDPTSIINEICGYVNSWRQLPNLRDWNATPETARLRQHWRHHAQRLVRSRSTDYFPNFSYTDSAQVILIDFISLKSICYINVLLPPGEEGACGA